MVNLNLIVKNEENLVIKIHRISLNVKADTKYNVKVFKEGQEIMNKAFKGSQWIELNTSMGEVLISCSTGYGQSSLFEKKFNLIDFLDKKNDNEVIIPDNLLKKVSYEMENPKGSIEEIERHTMMIKKSIYDKDAKYYVKEKIKQILVSLGNVELEDINPFKEEAFSILYGVGILQELDDNMDISEIMVNTTLYPEFSCNVYYTQTNQPKKLYNKSFKNVNEMLNVLGRILSSSDKELNSLENSTIETTRPNGDRITVVIPESSENYILNIRKFSNFVPTEERMIEVGTINEEINNLMKKLVKGKMNIGIGGEMGTGKTTFINYLLTHTSPIERKAIIANIKEINSNNVLSFHDIVYLNVDNKKGFTFEKQMETALRTTANRIIIPEARGKEFRQVYEANLKISGNMFTIHARSKEAFLDACVDMYAEGVNINIDMAKNKIAKSIDIIIIMKKIEDTIRIESISEVVTLENSRDESLNLLYFWDFNKKRYIKKNDISIELQKKINKVAEIS